MNATKLTTVRSDPPQPARLKGSGLGLALLRAIVLLAFTCAALPTSAATKQTAESEQPLGFKSRLTDAHTIAGEHAFYSLDYSRAVTEFSATVAGQPDNLYALNHLINAELFQELYRMGVLNTGDYADNGFVGKPHHPPDAKTVDHLRGLIQHTLDVSEQKLKANPNDVEALYCRGVTRGARSTFLGLVERSWFAALRNALGARHDHERVLELDPKFTDARLIVGVHEYVVGSLPWAVKVAASVVGEHGTKEDGVRSLESVMAGGSEAAEDARVVLVLFYRRENRLNDALKIVRDHLVRYYPQNMLMALEEGSLLWALGKPQEAEPIYQHIWENGKQGKYGALHYELAAIGLGDLRRSQKNYASAVEAYQWVDGVSTADPELRQKAAMGMGEALHAQGQDEAARQQFRRAINQPGGAEQAAKEARDRLKELGG